jgi:hypothetical protein
MSFPCSGIGVVLPKEQWDLSLRCPNAVRDDMLKSKLRRIHGDLRIDAVDERRLRREL